jgi:hypothetical protein
MDIVPSSVLVSILSPTPTPDVIFVPSTTPAPEIVTSSLV